MRKIFSLFVIILWILPGLSAYGQDSPNGHSCPDDNHPHMIDLGLPSGTKWACCNVEAATPNDLGGHYAWGETWSIGVDNYGGWESYSLYDSDAGACRNIGDDIAGTEYDVAHVKWGGVWCMPTENQFQELLENCTRTWETIDRGNDELPIYGYRFTAPNGGSIFFPAAGSNFGWVDESCLYWSSSLSSSDMAKMLFDYSIGERERWWGLSVRPVVGNGSSVVPITLAFSNVKIIVGGNKTVEITNGSGDYTVASSNEVIATATIDGSSVVVTAVGEGIAILTVTDTQSGQTATIEVTVTAPLSLCPNDHHPHMIDLGLPSGTKWACCNVDTDHPESQAPTNYGGYYAWGETAVKDYYSWGTYVHSDGSYNSLHPLLEDIARSKYDVAHAKWGKAWCMPSSAQIEELCENCTSEWTTVDGVYGRVVTGPNGASIFLPASGLMDGTLRNAGEYGYYWSSTRISPTTLSTDGFSFYSHEMYLCNFDRCYGANVRPIANENTSLLPLTLSSSNIETQAGETVTVDIMLGNGSYNILCSDEAVASAIIDDSSIIVSALRQGTATITVTDTESGETASIEVSVAVAPVSCPNDNHPHMIDLGLPSGTKWACCNVDTDHPENQSPTNYGGHFAWGEIEAKDYFDWTNYSNGTGALNDYYDIGSDISRTRYDVAFMTWGEEWCMPSKEQFDELLQNCTSEWTTIKGINGRVFIGENGGRIFLPGAGERWKDDFTNIGYHGQYWSSTQDSPYSANTLYFSSSFIRLDEYGRYCGSSVRPVKVGDISAISISSVGMATYCSPYDLDFSHVANLKAYIITGYDWQGKRVYATRVYDVPAGIGIYLVGDEGVYDVPRGASTSYYTNMLVGTLEETWIEPTDGDFTNLRLTGTSPQNASFKTFTQGRTFSANRAYLQIPTALLNTSANAVDIVFDDETDGIDGISQNVGETDNNWFTLDGRKLSGKPTTKGVYVVNGRKVVVK